MNKPRKRRTMNQINVVPYIDITLVLLVIFMVTAPMTNPGLVNLPKVGQNMQHTGNPIVVTVLKEGKLLLDGKKMTRDVMLASVAEAIAENPRAVVVAADEKVAYGEVVAVMDLLKQAKVDKVGLLFQPAQ